MGKKVAEKSTVQPSYTYADVNELNAALQRMKNENIVGSNMKFKTANIQNRVILQPLVAVIREATEDSPQWEEYQNKLYQLQDSHVQKFENGAIKFFQFVNGKEEEHRAEVQNSYTKWKNDAEYLTELNKLKEEYADAIKLKEDQPKLRKELMATTIESFPELKKVDGAIDSNLPESILDVLVRFNIINVDSLK